MIPLNSVVQRWQPTKPDTGPVRECSRIFLTKLMEAQLKRRRKLHKKISEEYRKKKYDAKEDKR